MRLRLPLLTARPGNVGVQIDAFRTMTMFNRPRCGKFTAQFQGITFENHSMDNYSRVVERTQVRARIVAERLQKLKYHEAKIVEDEQRRWQRRKEREAAEQRRLWLARQAAKKVEQIEREEKAARDIQRVARGTTARRHAAHLRRELEAHAAAKCLQVSFKTFVHKKKQAQHRLEREKEHHKRAAIVIQRHTRKRLASNRKLKSLAPSSAQDHEHDEPVAPTMNEDPSLPLQAENPGSDAPVPALHSEPSLELFFSATNSPKSDPTGTVTSASPVSSRPDAAPVRPRRPVTIKRVGGGFRHSTFQSPRLRSSRPPVLADAITQPRPQPPQHHQARSPRGRTYAPSKHYRPPAPTSDSSMETAETHDLRSGAVAPLDVEAIENENALLELVEQRDFEEALSEPIST